MLMLSFYCWEYNLIRLLSPFFLLPQLAESAKSQFSAGDYSDHLTLVRAYEGWKGAEREQNGYDYCWKNFLSLQTLKAIDSLRNQFLALLRDASLVDHSFGTSNVNLWSRDEHLVRAVICAGLYPGVSSVVVGSHFYFFSLFLTQLCLKCELMS